METKDWIMLLIPILFGGGIIGFFGKKCYKKILQKRNPFKINDIVKLIKGSPKMIIIKIDGSECHCVYINDKSKVVIFSKQALKLVNEENEMKNRLELTKILNSD